MNPISYTLTLSPAYVDYIYAALRKRPHEEVNDLIRAIEAQVMQQNARTAQADALVKKAADALTDQKTPEPPAALVAAAANGAHPPKGRRERRKAKSAAASAA